MTKHSKDPPRSKMTTLTVDHEVLAKLFRWKHPMEFRLHRVVSYNDVLRCVLGIDPIEVSPADAPTKEGRR